MDEKCLEIFELKYRKIINSSKIMYKTLASYNDMAFSLKKMLKETDLYVKYQEQAKASIEIIKQSIKSYTKELDKLISQLREKKEKVFNEVHLIEPNDVTQSVLDGIGKYNELIEETVKYGNNLQTEKNKTKETLRLNIVTQFLSDIKYQDLCTEITNLSSDANTKKTDYENLQ